MFMKRRWFLAVSLIFFSCLNLNAQQHFSKVDDFLHAHADEMGGRVMLMVYQNGKIVYSNAVNQLTDKQKMLSSYIAKKQGKIPNLEPYSSTTQQQIASCSKWLSAALVMTFVDEGKLKLTDTVGKFLPVLSKSGKGNITISQCLSHTTAIKAQSLKESLAEFKEVSTMDEAIVKISLLPMEGEPGKVFHYSNVGLQIAGAVIEKISGKDFETLFAERIAKPLNMKNTDFGHDKVALPAGGASSTPEDYMSFLTMILNKGLFNGKRILTEKSVVQMEINRITDGVRVAYSPEEVGRFGYGFGEWVMEKGVGQNISKSVSSPGLFGSFPWVNNEQKYGAFLMTFYLKSTGRYENYLELKRLVDEALKY